MDNFISGLVTSVLSNIIVIPAIYCITHARNKFTEKSRENIDFLNFASTVSLIFSSIIAAILFLLSLSSPYITPYINSRFLENLFSNALFYSLLFLSTGLVIKVLYYAIWGIRLQRAGIVAADIGIANNDTYKRSLESCQTELRFIGTGGHKLTYHGDIFEKAINRCNERSSSSAKFLLCDPSSKALEQAAIKAKKTSDTYQKKVKESLDKITDLKKTHANIEIRLYKASSINELPIFRLMFFNKNKLLASFNSYGSEHEGKEQPRLLIKATTSNSQTNSYYKPFDDLFNRLWDEGTPHE